MSTLQKTPISLLYELCKKKKVADPTFNDIDISKVPKEFFEPHLKFFIEAKAFDRSAIGAGATKQSAKHSAAERLLKEIDDTYDDDEAMGSSLVTDNNDYVSELLNFCVQKNYHKPHFIEIDSYGPSHSPTFIYECKIDSFAYKASANSKQIAKQQAAKLVLNVFKTLYPNMGKNVTVSHKNEDIEEEISKKITTYLDLKKRNKVDMMGTTIAQRHNFFRNYKNEDIYKDLIRVLGANVSDNEKCLNILKILKREWDYEIAPIEDSNLIKFELFIDSDQFTVVLIKNNEENLMKEILRYFTYMLDPPPAIIENYEFDYTSVDITLTPL